MIVPPRHKIYAKDRCSNYGKSPAHVDVPNEGGNRILADDGGKQYACAANEPRSVKRCIDESDLCCRGRVRPVQVSGSHREGHVRVIAIRGSAFRASCRIGAGNRVKGNFHDTNAADHRPERPGRSDRRFDAQLRFPPTAERRPQGP